MKLVPVAAYHFTGSGGQMAEDHYILIAAAERHTALALSSALAEGGFTVTTIVDTAEEAVRSISDGRVALAILDCSIPGMAAAAARTRLVRGVPVIFLAKPGSVIPAHELEAAAPSCVLPYAMDATLLRMNVEAVLRAGLATEEPFRAIADSTWDWEYWLSPEGVMLYTNPSCLRVTGYASGDFYANPGFLESIVHPDDRAAYDRHVEEYTGAREGDESSPLLIWRIITASGETRWIEHVCRPLFGADGSYRGRRASNRDVSERKKIEELFNDSEERFKTLALLAPIGIYLTDLNGDCFFVNNRWSEMAGFSIEEAKGDGWVRAIHPEDRDRVRDEWYETVRGRGRWGTEYRFVDGEGKITWVYGVAGPLHDARGELAGYIGANMDITARKMMEDERRRYNRLLDHVLKTQSLYITDGNYGQVFGSLLDALVELTGSEYGFLDEVRRDADGTLYKLSLAMSNISWDEDSRRLYDDLVARRLEFRNLSTLAGLPATSGKIVISNDPARDPRAAGLTAHHPPLKTYMGIPVLYGGEVVGVAGVANRPGGYDEGIAHFLQPLIGTCASIIHSMRLLEKQKALAGEVEESERLLRAMTDAVSESAILMKPDGTVEVINQCGARRLGLAPEEAVGRSIFDLVPPAIAASRRVMLEEVLSSGLSVQFEDERNGMSLLHSIYPVRDAGGEIRHLAVYAYDVTERRDFEIKQASSVREKEMLIKEIHHRVKNNFQVITSMLSLQGERIRNREVLDEFGAASERIRAMALVHEQLYYSEDLSRIDFGTYLHVLTYEIASYYRDPARTIEIVIECDSVYLSIDKAVPCGLIVNELITNAAKHAFPAGSCADCKIAVSFREREDGMLELGIADNGSGLPERYSVHEAKSFGLTLVTGLVQQLDGKLEVESGAGTSYSITFPGKSKPFRKT